MARLIDWVYRGIDWYGFGRTRGGFTFGYLLVHHSEPDPDAITASGGVSLGSIRWDPWVEWSPPLPRLRDLLPVVRVPRGGIRYG